MILKLGMKHQAMELYKAYINHDLVMTLTFFTARSTLVAHAFEWEKNRKMSFNGRKLARNEQMDRRFMFMKIFWAQVVVYPCPGGYIHVCDQNIQTSSLKPLGQSKPNFMWSILRKRE